MECKACKYYYLTKKEIEKEDIVFHDELEQNNGTEEFILITGQYMIGINKNNNKGRFNRASKLYACPKCGIIQLI